MNIKLKLPEGYLEGETRWDHYIDPEMKKIWAVELDLLAEFDRVCKKHGLRYCAGGGTLIGTIRHKGYIPWDDDIDLVMLRDDYEKLKKIAAEEFTAPYYFQTIDSDPQAVNVIAKLRNSETTAIRKKDMGHNYSYNQGIFIDIFPLDAVPDSKLSRYLLYAHALIYRGIYHYVASALTKKEPGIIDRILRKLARIIGGSRGEEYLQVKYYKKYDRLIRKYNKKDTKYVSMLAFNILNPRFQMYRKDLKKLTKLDYEFLKMPVPVEYDRNLRLMFGDYMTPVKGDNLHGGMLFDTEHPYTDHL